MDSAVSSTHETALSWALLAVYFKSVNAQVRQYLFFVVY